MDAIDVGNRRELFVDDFVIGSMSGAAQRLHHPTSRDVAITLDASWEGNSCGYVTIFEDGDIYRMYYRGSQVDEDTGKTPHPEFACYAESRDGIRWTKPELGIVAFQGSKQNNIIWDGAGTHNFAPFRDTNPNCPPDARYKAFGRTKGKAALHAFRSPDGIHWVLMRDAPVITDGKFDSQNVGFWDAQRGEYRAYYRDFRDGVRDIKTATSRDFLTWTPGEWLAYLGAPDEQLYTNQVIPYYRAPHLFLGFPTRYVHDRGVLTDFNRKLAEKQTQRTGTSYTDGLLMSSRDGRTFHRFGDAFIRPGMPLEDRWVYGNIYQNWGIVETASDVEGAPNELSFYVGEGARRDGARKLRRYTLRIDGFVSMHAPASGGGFVTKPLRFSGSRLALNFSTSAAGAVGVEVQDAEGHPVEGFGLEACADLYGDFVERTVGWKTEDIGALAGTAIRLRFVLRDADLFSFQIV